MLAVTSTAVVNVAWAEPGGAGGAVTPVSAVMSGASPDGLGSWEVHYQRLNADESATASAIDEHIDAEANRGVTQATWEASTKHAWTFTATGSMNVRPTTVSEVFVGQYDTDEPNMPMQTLGTVVCDARSGIVINWDNLFRDKTAGLTRLSEQTEASQATVASSTDLRDWRRAGQFAPIDINFKYWIATAEGIELHFSGVQFGHGLKAVTVPWAKVADQIAPEFIPITG